VRRRAKMFQETAREWIEQWQGEGLLERGDEARTARLVKDCAARIEEIFTAAVTRQLTPLGKAADFERLLLWDTQYVHKFLNQTIPAYYNFREEVLAEARRTILAEFTAGGGRE